MTAALEMQRTRPTRIKVAGIQTYPLTWVPAGHSEHSHSGRRGRELPVSKLIHPEDTPPALPQPRACRAESSRGYENAASLVFLPCFSPADSQNALSQSEGRGVLEENKRILPPILSRGVAFPSQIQQTGSNGVKRIHTRPLLAEKASRGRTHNRRARQVCTAAVSPRLGDSPQVAWPLQSSATGGVHLAGRHSGGGRPSRGKRLPLECVVKEEHHKLPGPHSQQSRERPGAVILYTSSRASALP